MWRFSSSFAAHFNPKLELPRSMKPGAMPNFVHLLQIIDLQLSKASAWQSINDLLWLAEKVILAHHLLGDKENTPTQNCRINRSSFDFGLSIVYRPPGRMLWEDFRAHQTHQKAFPEMKACCLLLQYLRVYGSASKIRCTFKEKISAKGKVFPKTCNPPWVFLFWPPSFSQRFPGFLDLH